MITIIHDQMSKRILALNEGMRVLQVKDLTLKKFMK